MIFLVKHCCFVFLHFVPFDMHRCMQIMFLQIRCHSPPIAGVSLLVFLQILLSFFLPLQRCLLLLFYFFCKYCYHSSSGVGLLLVSCFWQLLVSFSSHCGVACCCCWKYPGTHFAAALFLEEERQIVRQAKNLPSPLS